jgi:LPXTG-motif cell wall-anchored protein
LITTVKTVTGTVWLVNPPSTVILRLDNNTNQTFKIPEGQKFKVNDRRQEVDAWGLRKGMKIDAQQVTEESQTEVEQEVKRTGVMPPPPPPPAPNVAILILAVPAPVETASAAPAEAEPTPTKLPKTASNLPAVGLLGVLLLALGLALKGVRNRNA